ncbi:MAG TPA: peptidoglycan DD-metalloendopeptidase family protein [Caldisericia bacterium]|nr:peptidoglycan DD-metalloendopeptidase family protein [Caldisericia bacterium]
MKKVVIILVLFITLFSMQAFKTVSSIDVIEDLTNKIEEKKKETERINSAIKEINALIEDQKKKKDSALDELNILENQISLISKELEQLSNEEEKLKLSYTKCLKEIEILDNSIKTGEEQLNKILFTLYKNYTLNYSAFIFSSKSFNEIMDKSIYLQFLISADKSYINGLKNNKEKKSILLEEQVDNQIRLSVLVDEKKKKSEELSNLEKKKEIQISKLAYKLETSKKELDSLIEAQERTEREIQELIKRKEEEIRKRKFKQTPMGPLIWPVNGTITKGSGFGMRLHPIFGVYRMHTGIDIDAPYGTPIKAVQSGYIIYADWLGGYGNTVIIQHDEKHSTLYGHMRSYSVQIDQYVNQGSIIGSVGSTGWSTSPHLHFEVRINGDPTDPLNFLP